MTENVTVEPLTPKQRAAIAALVSGQSYGDAARTAGVSERTLRRWRLDPQFAAEIRRADSEQLGEIARVLNGASRTAVDVLITIMTDGRASKALRLRAAVEVLKHRAALFDLTTLSERLDELEKRLP